MPLRGKRNSPLKDIGLNRNALLYISALFHSSHNYPLRPPGGVTSKPHVMPTPFPPYGPAGGAIFLRSCPPLDSFGGDGPGYARRVIPLS